MQSKSNIIIRRKKKVLYDVLTLKRKFNNRIMNKNKMQMPPIYTITRSNAKNSTCDLIVSLSEKNSKEYIENSIKIINKFNTQYNAFCNTKILNIVILNIIQNIKLFALTTTFFFK